MSVRTRSTTRTSRRSAKELAGKHIHQHKPGTAKGGMYFVKIPKGAVDKHGKVTDKFYGPFPGTPEGLAAAVAARDKHFEALEARHVSVLPIGKAAAGMTLAEWMPSWLKDIANEAAASTHAKYARSMEQHVLPFLGNVPMAELTNETIKAWRDARSAAGLGPDGVNYALKRLKTCLSAAVASKSTTGLVENPAQGKAVKFVRIGQRKRFVTSREDYPKLLAAAGDHHLAAVIRVTLDSGLREGELTALRWSDIDWEARRLWVRWHMVSAGSVKKGEHIDQFVPGAKTSKGEYMAVQLSSSCIEALRAHRSRLRELQGPGWKAGQATKFFEAAHSGSRNGKAYVVPTDPGAEEALVFPSLDGTPLMTQNLYGWFQGVCRRAGVEKSFHWMRHDCGSFMLAANPPVPLAVVSKHLRHATVAITAEIYSHEIEEQRRAGADAMDSLWASMEATAIAV